MPMTCVVTGALGFLGRTVTARLLAEGYVVVAVDLAPPPSALPSGLRYVQADLCEPRALLPDHTEGSSAPFTLIHLAWDMRRFGEYASQARQVSMLAGLLDYWTGRGLSRLVALGSAEEYGRRSGILDEHAEPGLPLSSYGWAKRAARDLVKSWSLSTGVDACWLRPFIVYGPGQRGDMLIPSAIEAAQQRRRTAFTDGRQCRDFLHVEDVAEAVARCLAVRPTGHQEFNLGRGEAVPVASVLTAIARHYDAEQLFELGARPRRAGEPELQVANPAHARATLGWTAKYGVLEGLARLLSAHDAAGRKTASPGREK